MKKNRCTEPDTFDKKCERDQSGSFDPWERIDRVLAKKADSNNVNSSTNHKPKRGVDYLDRYIKKVRDSEPVTSPDDRDTEGFRGSGDDNKSITIPNSVDQKRKALRKGERLSRSKRTRRGFNGKSKLQHKNRTSHR